MSALIYAFAALAAIALLLETIARAAPAAVAQMPKVRAARQRYEEIEEKAKAALGEITNLKAQRDQMTDDIMLVEARLKDAKRRAAAFAAGRTVFVHEMGRSSPERRLYEVYVTNPLVLLTNKPSHIERVNVIYGQPQLIEIWAGDMAEARAALEYAYPKPDGFEIEYSGNVIEPTVSRKSVE